MRCNMKGIDTLREIVKNMEKKEIVDLSYEEFINLMNKINDEENFMLGGNIWNIAVAIEKKRNTELFKYYQINTYINMSEIEKVVKFQKDWNKKNK